MTPLLPLILACADRFADAEFAVKYGWADEPTMEEAQLDAEVFALAKELTEKKPFRIDDEYLASEAGPAGTLYVSAFDECQANAEIDDVNYGDLALQCADALTRLEKKNYTPVMTHNGLLVNTYKIVPDKD